jgi:hypothetical protein
MVAGMVGVDGEWYPVKVMDGRDVVGRYMENGKQDKAKIKEGRGGRGMQGNSEGGGGGDCE